MNVRFHPYRNRRIERAQLPPLHHVLSRQRRGAIPSVSSTFIGLIRPPSDLTDLILHHMEPPPHVGMSRSAPTTTSASVSAQPVPAAPVSAAPVSAPPGSHMMASASRAAAAPAPVSSASASASSASASASASSASSASKATTCLSAFGGADPPVSSQKESKRRERWTEEEHENFLVGLERYGRKWKKIQAYVKSKTPIQVRTHAYGYFAKLLRNMPEHVCVWDASGTLTAIKAPDDDYMDQTDIDRRGLEILQKHVLSKRRPGQSGGGGGGGGSSSLQ